MTSSKPPAPTWIINTVIVAVVLVWIANFIARATVHEYNPPEGVDALMLAVVGFLLAGRQAASNAALPPPTALSDDEDDGERDDRRNRA